MPRQRARTSSLSPWRTPRYSSMVAATFSAASLSPFCSSASPSSTTRSLSGGWGSVPPATGAAAAAAAAPPLPALVDHGGGGGGGGGAPAAVAPSPPAPAAAAVAVSAGAPGAVVAICTFAAASRPRSERPSSLPPSTAPPITSSMAARPLARATSTCVRAHSIAHTHTHTHNTHRSQPHAHASHRTWTYVYAHTHRAQPHYSRVCGGSAACQTGPPNKRFFHTTQTPHAGPWPVQRASNVPRPENSASHETWSLQRPNAAAARVHARYAATRQEPVRARNHATAGRNDKPTATHTLTGSRAHVPAHRGTRAACDHNPAQRHAQQNTNPAQSARSLANSSVRRSTRTGKGRPAAPATAAARHAAHRAHAYVCGCVRSSSSSGGGGSSTSSSGGGGAGSGGHAHASSRPADAPATPRSGCHRAAHERRPSACAGATVAPRLGTTAAVRSPSRSCLCQTHAAAENVYCLPPLRCQRTGSRRAARISRRMRLGTSSLPRTILLTKSPKACASNARAWVRARASAAGTAPARQRAQILRATAAQRWLAPRCTRGVSAHRR